MKQDVVSLTRQRKHEALLMVGEGSLYKGKLLWLRRVQEGR